VSSEGELAALSDAGATVAQLAAELKAVRARAATLAVEHRAAKDALRDLVLAALADRLATPTEIAAAAGINRTTLYFLLNNKKKKGGEP
jgi:hypothetical protein